MPAVTKHKLKSILTKRLRLRKPEFVIHKVGGKLSGSVIDERFVGIGDLQRQQMIWNAWEWGLGPGAPGFVGTLLAYTRAEWESPLEGRPKEAKKAG